MYHVKQLSVFLLEGGSTFIQFSPALHPAVFNSICDRHGSIAMQPYSRKSSQATNRNQSRLGVCMCGVICMDQMRNEVAGRAELSVLTVEVV